MAVKVYVKVLLLTSYYILSHLITYLVLFGFIRGHISARLCKAVLREAEVNQPILLPWA